MELQSVSVIIPCYNGGRYLIEAVESVKKQGGQFTLDEIILVDDHSTDVLTQSELKKLQEDPQVKIVTNIFAKGPGGARNTGIQLVESEWVVFLDADDILLSDSLEARLMALRRHPEINWCGGDFVILYDDGTYSEPVYRSGQKTSLAFDGYSFDKPLVLMRPVKHFLGRMITWIGAVIIRTNVLKGLKGFSEHLLHSEDSNLFVRIALKHDFLFVPDVLFVHRSYPGSYSTTRRAPCEWAIKNLSGLLEDEDFRRYRKLIKKRISQCHWSNCEHYFQHRQYVDGFREFVLHKFYRYLAKSESRKDKLRG